MYLAERKSCINQLISCSFSHCYSYIQLVCTPWHSRNGITLNYRNQLGSRERFKTKFPKHYIGFVRLSSMTNPYQLFDELNTSKHVCLHSANACSFCVTKIHVPETVGPDLRTKYLAPFEVVVHNQPSDIWVSFLGKVYDLTSLVQEHRDERCIAPLLAFAGKDLSHWFNEADGDIVHFIHPITGVRVPYCPHGPLPHVNSQVPNTKWQPLDGLPWWADEKYIIGHLTKRVRPVRIQNMLTGDICAINVCMEDKLERILERYLMFNSDACSYTWCYDNRVLDMDKTLAQNDIPDERDQCTHVGLPENTYVPLILLYYNDNLKWE